MDYAAAYTLLDGGMGYNADFPGMGYWIMGYRPQPDVPVTPCGGDDEWPACHPFHCVNCGTGTDPGPMDGAELRETWEPAADYRSRAEYPGRRDIWGPLGDGYEFCRPCLEQLEWLF